MFAFFQGASFKIARNLIKVTGLSDSLAVFQQNTFSTLGTGEVLKLLLAVDACNLMQTMKEDFIQGEIPEEDLQDTVEDYLVENLKAQTAIPCRDGAERMEQCQEILGMAAKFQEYWAKEEYKDPGPRFYCVKELLGRLGSEANGPIHDNLFEFVYEQHNRFIRYFRTLLEPLSEEETSEPATEPPPLAVSLHSSSSELKAKTQESLTDEGMVTEMTGETPVVRVDSTPLIPSLEEGPAVDSPPEIGKVLPDENLFPAESLSPPPAGPVKLEIPQPSPVEPFRGGTPGSFSKPMPQLLDELFQKVNPIDPDFSRTGFPPEPLSSSLDPGPMTEEGIATEALKEEPALEIGQVPPDEDFLNVQPKG